MFKNSSFKFKRSLVFQWGNLLKMNNLIIFASLIALSMAQRPTYAGSSPKGYPELHSRFRDTTEDNQTTSQSVINNRIGEDVAQPTQNIPTDARGDAVLIDRLNQWPRENRPFWLLNAEHIEKQRHPDVDGNQQNGSSSQQQESLRGNVQGFVGKQQDSTGDERVILGGGPKQTVAPPPNGNGSQRTQFQARLGGGEATETRTIRPLDQRSSFVSSRRNLN